MLQHVPVVLWERDGETGRFVYVSDESARLLGLPAPHWTEQPGFWEAHVHPEDRDAAQRSFVRHIAEGTGYSIEYRMLAGDGRVVWVRDIMSVVLSHGHPTHAYGVLIDVTAGKAAEEALALQRARLRRQNVALFRITMWDTLHGGDLHAALRSIVEAAAEALEVAATSVWTHEDANIRCLDRYDRATAAHAEGLVIPAPHFPAYQAALESTRAVVAASTDAETRRDADAYAARFGLSALLDAPVRVGGKVVGVLRHEHTGAPRAWTADEEQFAASMADLTALAVEANERRRAEAALRVSRAQTRAVVEGSQEAILVVDGEGHIVEFNRAAEAMFGRARPDVLGQDLGAQLVPERLRAAADEALAGWRKAVGLGEQRVELIGRCAAGREFPMEIVGFSVPDDGGSLTIGFVRDLSRPNAAPQLDQLESLVEARTRDVRAAMQEMESFSYTVSHDLRAPIRAIDAFAQLLVDECGDQLGERGDRYLARIRAAARRLGSLVNDFMLLARVVSADLTRVPVDVSAIGGAVLEELRQSAPDRDVKVHVEEGLTANGDPGLVRILLENLLGNAWKFTAKHPQANIELGGDPGNDGGARVFYVRDDGAGFDPLDASRLFQPFSRLHGTGEFEGTGIGLAIARKIVERHGGRIWAEGRVEGGATFRFTFGREAPEQIAPYLSSTTAT
ncbi:MAG: PAS domain S-box protein [Pseudomonadota bacterium]|nr:PAS domain S-box protein [Pseudomonadota bacterium]